MTELLIGLIFVVVYVGYYVCKGLDRLVELQVKQVELLARIESTVAVHDVNARLGIN